MKLTPNSENDFGNNIIPNPYATGVRCTPIISAATGRMWEPFLPLWEANMEVLDPEHSGINLFDRRLEDLQPQQRYDRSSHR